jgi:hypothetical protein
MRGSRTSSYVVVGVAGVLGVLAVGCSGESGADRGAFVMPVDPSAEASNPSEAETSAPPPPVFEAEFSPDAGAAKSGGTSSSTPPPAGSDPAPTDPDSCLDASDPGAQENASMSLPAANDCDATDKTLSGVMKGAADVDFYSVSATDDWCSYDPEFESQTAGTELCVYARCKNTNVNAVTGCSQGVQSTSGSGLSGCCAAAPGRAVPTLDCGSWSGDDSADFFVRVRQINGDKCLPYTLRYRF